MPRASLVPLIAVIAASTSCLSQSAPPAAPPAPPGTASSAPAPTAPPVATLKANAQLVIVDVVATDSDHRPVHSLTAADFALTENGVPQTVKAFEEHAAPVLDPAHLPPALTLPPGVFTNYNPAPASGAVNLLLLDTLNTPMTGQAYVRQQLLAYLKSCPPGTRIAVFGLTNRLVLLQGFTSDPAILRTLLEKHAGKGSPLLDDAVGGGGIHNSEADTLEDQGDDPVIVANIRQFEAEQQSYQLQFRIQLTLDAFNQLARYLADIPGRKNLIWFSGSFPINILPDDSGTLSNPFAVAASFGDEFRQTVDLLSRGQVAVYPVDARGLTNSPVFDVTTDRNYTGAKGIARLNQDQSKFLNDTATEHATMNAMADATGGHAFLNTNDLAHAVASAISQGSNFYTLAYTPTNSAHDGKMRHIKVHSARAGLTLTYRQGYYADPPDKITTAAAPAPDAAAAGVPGQDAASAGGLTPHQTLRLAMLHGAPAPTDILMKAGVVPITPAAHPEDKPAPGDLAAPKAHGPWRRYSVNYEIDPVDLVFFTGSDGKVHSDFDLIIFVYSPDGDILNSRQNSVHLAGTLDQMRAALKQGIICHEEVSAPAKGESFLRIAVHDLHRDHYGAVEVATSQVSRVVPYTPPAPAAAAPAPPPAPAASK